jgi:hypothetical protein
MAQTKCVIATTDTEPEALDIKRRLHDVGVPTIWTAYCELITRWTVLVPNEDARGAYVRLQSLAI